MRPAPGLRRTRHRRGTQMLEFALLMPFFFVLILFTFDVGRFVLTSTALHDAAYTASRAGAQVGGGNLENSRTALAAFEDTARLNPMLGNGSLTGELRSGATCTAAGPDRFVTVRGTYRMQLLSTGMLFFLGGVIPSSVDVTSVAVSRCEVVRS